MRANFIGTSTFPPLWAGYNIVIKDLASQRLDTLRRLQNTVLVYRTGFATVVYGSYASYSSSSCGAGALWLSVVVVYFSLGYVFAFEFLLVFNPMGLPCAAGGFMRGCRRLRSGGRSSLNSLFTANSHF